MHGNVEGCARSFPSTFLPLFHRTLKSLACFNYTIREMFCRILPPGGLLLCSSVLLPSGSQLFRLPLVGLLPRCYGPPHSLAAHLLCAFPRSRLAFVRFESCLKIKKLNGPCGPFSFFASSRIRTCDLRLRRPIRCFYTAFYSPI